MSVAWIVLFAAYRLYEGETRAIAPASFDEVGKTFHALLAGSLLLLVVGQGAEKAFDLSIYTPLEALMFLEHRARADARRSAARCGPGCCRP